jgi:hypothetical protein
VRWQGSLGLLALFIVAVACSESEAQDAAAAGGPAASSEGGTDAVGPAPSASTPKQNLGDPLDCCSARQAPGCAHEAVEQCVCDESSYCCSKAWDGACVRHVEELGCGLCPVAVVTSPAGGAGGEASSLPTGEGSGPGEWSSCCAEQSGPGCGDEAVEECVCYVDDYCCTQRWDDYCAGEVSALSCAACSTFNAGGAGGAAAGGAAGEDGD